MKPSRDLLRQEFIGIRATVISPGVRKPIEGKIIDETRNMIRLEGAGKEVWVPKKGSRISLRFNNDHVEILGDWIIGSPADRIKKRIRRS